MTPYDHDDHRQSDENRTALFLACFRTAIKRGFYPDAFGKMPDRDVMGLVANYIAHHTENLTIFDPHFLETLYGDQAMRKAHWLIELRMRRMDIVPALYKDLHTVTIKPADEKEPPPMVLGSKPTVTLNGVPIECDDVQMKIGPEMENAIDRVASAMAGMVNDLCSKCFSSPCNCDAESSAKQS
jgi:hypothetical protein